MDKKSTQRWVIGIVVSMFASAFFFVCGVIVSVALSNATSETNTSEHTELEHNQVQILSAVYRTKPKQREPELALVKPRALVDVVTDNSGHQVAESFRALFVNIGGEGAMKVSTQWKNIQAEIPGSNTRYHAPKPDPIEPASPMALGPNERVIMPELPNVFQTSIGARIQTATGQLDVKYLGADGKSHSKSYTAKFVRAVDGGLVLYVAEIEFKSRHISFNASDWG